jgi:hypothetical protein
VKPVETHLHVRGRQTFHMFPFRQLFLGCCPGFDHQVASADHAAA